MDEIKSFSSRFRLFEDYISIGITVLGDRRKIQFLFKSTAESSVSTENEQNDNNSNGEKQEFVNIVKNGKEYCYKATDPEKLLCRKCHANVSEESTLCWNCNNNLVYQDSNQSFSYDSHDLALMENSSSNNSKLSENCMVDNKDKSNKNKSVKILLGIAFCAIFLLSISNFILYKKLNFYSTAYEVFHSNLYATTNGDYSNGSHGLYISDYYYRRYFNHK